MSDFIKFRPVGAELYHTEGRTDMTKMLEKFKFWERA